LLVLVSLCLLGFQDASASKAQAQVQAQKNVVGKLHIEFPAPVSFLEGSNSNLNLDNRLADNIKANEDGTASWEVIRTDDPLEDNGWYYESGNRHIIIGGAIIVTLTLMVAGYFMFLHYNDWRNPPLQKYYIRLAMLGPVYSCCAMVSIYQPDWHGTFNVFRSAYECWALYSLMNLMIMYSGGKDRVKEIFAKKQDQIKCYILPGVSTCGIKNTDGAFYFWTMCVKQFFFTKVTIAIFMAITEEEHNIVEHDKYFQSIYLLCMTIAILGLMNIWYGLSEQLVGLHAGRKFSLVKGAVMLTAWQEAIFHILVGEDIIDSMYCKTAPHVLECHPDIPKQGVRTVACLVVIQMFIYTIVALRTFSNSEKALDNFDAGAAAQEEARGDFFDRIAYIVSCFGYFPYTTTNTYPVKPNKIGSGYVRPKPSARIV